MLRYWLLLLLAIVCEVIATSALRATNGFTRLVPAVIVVAGYLCSFYFVSLTLKAIPVGIAYAVWSGVGTLMIVLIAWLFMGQKLGLHALAGIFLIIAGVVVLNLFSKPVVH